MIVKICANRDLKDAKMSLDAGADMLGVLVGQKHSSDDFISKEVAKNIIDFVDNRAKTVLVTHLTKADEIIELTKYIGNDVIQLHSNIDELEVEKIKTSCPQAELIRLIHITEEGKIYSDISQFKYVDYFLLDRFNLNTNQVGGTGLTSDWTECQKIIKHLNRPAFLAGGLTPENVKTAIKLASPHGVDVNSGCKDKTGRKNAKKVKLFVSNAKSFS